MITIRFDAGNYAEVCFFIPKQCVSKENGVTKIIVPADKQANNVFGVNLKRLCECIDEKNRFE